MFFSLLLVWIPVLIFTASAIEFRTHHCGLNTTTSTFYSNLIQVLNSLDSDSTVNDYKFLTKTAGNSPPDIAYGLYLCRADVLPSDCGNCLVKAREDINKTCPSKEAVFWNDYCMLHYTNRSIVSVMDTATFVPECNQFNISQKPPEQTQFWEVARKMLGRLATQASTDPKKRFAFHELSYTGNRNLFGYVECTPDLSGSDCSKCLGVSINHLQQYCYGRRGARVLTPSCSVRFEIYKFLQFSAPSSESPGKKKISSTIIKVVVGVLGVLAVISSICYFFVLKKPRLIVLTKMKGEAEEGEVTDEQSIQFELSAIEAATNNFCIHNKIGEGGFGGVYKGVLSNGRIIAVKRLSKSSGQGEIEFKNEVVLLAKLQHRNLVRLLGFCLAAEEKILIYEYVPNQSLDCFLFDPIKQAQLDWPTRYKIIGGIARGMLYLHEDSRLRIIHRDLKASNILLDEDMNPKISDFGMARIFCGNQTQAKTCRIVGTFGYMSPEYAMHGSFSVRSDVFSFGVLVLEIVSGSRNTRHSQYGRVDLLCDAWYKWKNGEPLQIMDSNMMHSSSTDEVLRCINIALLCVQEYDELRPSMASIVLMLNSNPVALPLPENPPFVSHRKSMTQKGLESDNNTSTSTVCVLDASLITDVHPR